MDSWKFTARGVTREVTVVDTGRTGVQRYAVERCSAQFLGACPEDAVIQYTQCAGFLDLREIVPPGAPTRDEIRRERDAWAHRAEQAEAQAAALAARVATLEGIIEGRTTPPTDAEIDAHAAAGAAVVALTELAQVLADNGIALGVPLGRVVDLVGSVVDTLVPACNLDAGFASAGRSANARLLGIERDARSRGVILRRDLDRITPALDGGL